MPHAAHLLIATALIGQTNPGTATQAKFLMLIITLVAVFLGGLAVLTVARMVRRRHAAREDRISKVRTPSVTPLSPWKAAGARARPDPRADDDAPGDGNPDDADPDADPDDPFGEDFEPTGYDEDDDDDFDPDGGDDDDLEDTDDGPAFR